MDELLEQLKAVAEPTRLRIVVALEACELTVSEICLVLGQTQPRVSRHLKLLTDAGLLHRHAEGSTAYYGIRDYPEATSLLRSISHLIDRQAPVLERDRERLEAVRVRRTERAATYFAEVASEWEQLREMHASTAAVEEAMLRAIEPPSVDSLLDIGTGTGRILELFADRTARGLGIDSSRQMLGMARARLDDDLLNHCSVRLADIYDLDVEDNSQDVVIIHHVLHFLTDPLSALSVASRVLAPGGTLLVVDFAKHDVERLRSDHAHLHLGFTESEMTGWLTCIGLTPTSTEYVAPEQGSSDETLTVALWTAQKATATSGQAGQTLEVTK